MPDAREPVGEFSGTIIYHSETGITFQEQLLSTAAAIAFVS